ncbi:MAG TPA: zinc ribbon domain-containing protein, partial [Dehalococcoidia bacterium]
MWLRPAPLPPGHLFPSHSCEVVLVDHRNSSVTCSECGSTDKANRRSQSLFSCTSCGYRC